MSVRPAEGVVVEWMLYGLLATGHHVLLVPVTLEAGRAKRLNYELIN